MSIIPPTTTLSSTNADTAIAANEAVRTVSNESETKSKSFDPDIDFFEHWIVFLSYSAKNGPSIDQNEILEEQLESSKRLSCEIKSELIDRLNRDLVDQNEGTNKNFFIVEHLIYSNFPEKISSDEDVRRAARCIRQPAHLHIFIRGASKFCRNFKEYVAASALEFDDIETERSIAAGGAEQSSGVVLFRYIGKSSDDVEREGIYFFTELERRRQLVEKGIRNLGHGSKSGDRIETYSRSDERDDFRMPEIHQRWIPVYGENCFLRHRDEQRRESHELQTNVGGGRASQKSGVEQKRSDGTVSLSQIAKNETKKMVYKISSLLNAATKEEFESLAAIFTPSLYEAIFFNRYYSNCLEDGLREAREASVFTTFSEAAHRSYDNQNVYESLPDYFSLEESIAILKKIFEENDLFDNETLGYFLKRISGVFERRSNYKNGILFTGKNTDAPRLLARSLAELSGFFVNFSDICRYADLKKAIDFGTNCFLINDLRVPTALNLSMWNKIFRGVPFRNIKTKNKMMPFVVLTSEAKHGFRGPWTKDEQEVMGLDILEASVVQRFKYNRRYRGEKEKFMKIAPGAWWIFVRQTKIDSYRRTKDRLFTDHERDYSLIKNDTDLDRIIEEEEMENNYEIEEMSPRLCRIDPKDGSEIPIVGRSDDSSEIKKKRTENYKTDDDKIGSSKNPIFVVGSSSSSNSSENDDDEDKEPRKKISARNKEERKSAKTKNQNRTSDERANDNRRRLRRIESSSSSTESN